LIDWRLPVLSIAFFGPFRCFDPAYGCRCQHFARVNFAGFFHSFPERNESVTRLTNSKTLIDFLPPAADDAFQRCVMKTAWIAGGLIFVLGMATQWRGARAGADRDGLLAADRAFDAATAAKKFDGFSSFLADNVATLRADQPVLRGKVAMQQAWKPLLENQALSLRWQPTSAEISKSKDLGYTVGSYTLTQTNEKGSAVVGTGKYLTVWRLQKDGTWKVEFDTGVPDTDPAKAKQ
jgi:ketosteroid isomerase-like protein